MQVLVFAVTVGLAVYFTDRWAIQREAVYPMTLASAGVWSFLTLRGTSITSNIGGEYTETYPYLGYVWLFLAITSILAILAHHRWGILSADEEDERAPRVEASSPDSPNSNTSDSR